MMTDKDYSQIKSIVYKSSAQFLHLYGGNFKELVSQANVACIKAWNTYDPERGTKISTWVKFVVDRELIENLRKNLAKKRNPPISSDNNIEQVISPYKTFDLGEFLRDLSDDARTVIELLLTMPNDLAFLTRRPKQTWTVLVRELVRMKWTKQRISKIYKEISEALV